MRLKRKLFIAVSIMLTWVLSACGFGEKAKELTEEEAKEAAVHELQKILPAEKQPVGISLYYQNNQDAIDFDEGTPREGLIQYRALWRADFSFDGGDDYQIWINAVDGTASNIFRYPEDWFDTAREYKDYTVEGQADYTEEDFLKTAEGYCERAGYQVQESYNLFQVKDNLILYNPGPTMLEGRVKWPVEYYEITVVFEGGGGATIGLSVKDMSLLSARFVPAA